MQTGHINCYYSPDNKFVTADFNIAKELAMDKMLAGWKVCIDQDAETKLFYIYWGA